MAEAFLGEIRITPFNFSPNGWAQCNGQLMAISQNTALFSLLGTYYGGDGRSTFALPNFQGMLPVDAGSGAGLTQRLIGETGGEASVNLTVAEIPAHAHVVNADSSGATASTPTGNLLAVAAAGPRHPNQMYAPTPTNVAMQLGNATLTGGNLPHNNLQPYLTLNFIIALQGIYPARQ